MKAYSTDLRQKIIETYENERISQRQLAQRFRVTLSFTAHLPEAQDTWAVLSDQTPYLHTFALY
jgi:transposase